ncbi:sensor histidine kinase [Daejeonia sp. YH14]|uniref:sensor histidine kinase n=1 Tax=Daejeonia sp. YH14 TaxID=3439042 RepID=UPI003F494AA0
MKNFRLNKSSFLLMLLFVLASALIFFLMALTYKHLQKLSENTYMVNHSLEVSLDLEKLYADLKDIEVERRNFVLIGNSNSEKIISGKKKNISRIYKNLEVQFSDNPEQQRNLRILNVLILDKYKVVDAILQSSPSILDNREKLSQSLRKGENIISAIHLQMDRMLDIENHLLAERRNEFTFTERSTPFYIYLISLLSLGLLSFSFYRLYHDAKRQKNINKKLEMALNLSAKGQVIGKYGYWRWFMKDNSYYFSDNQLQIFGMDPTMEISLDDFLPYVYPDDIEIVSEMQKKMYAHDANIGRFTHRIIRKDNHEVRYLSISNSLIHDKEQGDYYLIITQDVTEEKIQNERIEEKNRVLETQNKELMAFNYVASHDLQEPLRKIETFLSRLRDKDEDRLSDNGKQYLQRTLASAGRMRKLIDDLLQFSRTTRTEQVYEFADLNDLLDNAVDNLNPLIEEKSAKITSDRLPGLYVVPFQIQQLFTNLIGNSLKYCRDGIAPEIHIECRKTTRTNLPFPTNGEKYYEIIFTDNGIGFENEYREKIFELFNRLHGKNEYEGTGIGLAICKKIAENHKGNILAEGRPGEGSTFRIFLPQNL